MGFVKSASRSELSKAASLLDSIYAENPVHWPHGLTTGHFRPGNLFLVYKEAAAHDPVGFVGWQERIIGPSRVGFYSVGTLPEFRGQGVAKQAVAKLIASKSASVDRVCALVVDGNTPSEKLASRLGIPLFKEATFLSTLGKGLNHQFTRNATAGLGGAYGTMMLQDNSMHPEEPITFNPFTPFTSGDKSRAIIGAVNAALGGGAGIAAKKSLGALRRGQTGQAAFYGGAAMTGGLISPITKDLIMHGHKGIAAADRLSKEGPAALNNLAAAVKDLKGQAQQATGMSGGALLGAAGIVAAALGAGAYGVSKAIQNQQPSTINMQEGGRLRVTLPTKNPGDAETTVEMPYDPQTSMTAALRNRIDLDTRRRLYAETRSRINRRGQEKPDLQVN